MKAGITSNGVYQPLMAMLTNCDCAILAQVNHLGLSIVREHQMVPLNMRVLHKHGLIDDEEGNNECESEATPLIDCLDQKEIAKIKKGINEEKTAAPFLGAMAEVVRSNSPTIGEQIANSTPSKLVHDLYTQSFEDNKDIEAHEKALYEAIKEGQEKRVRILLSFNPLSTYARGMMVKEAARYNNSEIVKLLIESGPINDVYRGLAVLEATSNNYNEMVQLLLDSGDIDDSCRKSALVKARRQNNKTLQGKLQIQSNCIIG